MGCARGAAAAAPDGIGGDADADRRSDRAGDDQATGMAQRPGDRVAGVPRAGQAGAETRLEARGDAAARPGSRAARRRARRAAGRRARCRPRRRPTPGESPSRTPSTARSRRSAADGWGLITLLLTPRSPIRYTVRCRSRRAHRTAARRTPSSSAASSRSARCWRTRTAPSLRPRTSPISRAVSPSTKRRIDDLAPILRERRDGARAADGRRRRGRPGGPDRPMAPARARRRATRFDGGSARAARWRAGCARSGRARPEGRSLVAVAVDGAQRGHEGALGRVLGVVVVAEQVEAVAVDAVQVAAVERARRPRGPPAPRARRRDRGRRAAARGRGARSTLMRAPRADPHDLAAGQRHATDPAPRPPGPRARRSRRPAPRPARWRSRRRPRCRASRRPRGSEPAASGPASTASSSASSASRSARQQLARSIGTPARSASDVARAAISGGISARGQLTLIPMPITAEVTRSPSIVVSSSRPPTFAPSSDTMSFGHLSATGAPRRRRCARPGRPPGRAARRRRPQLRPNGHAEHQVPARGEIQSGRAGRGRPSAARPRPRDPRRPARRGAPGRGRSSSRSRRGPPRRGRPVAVADPRAASRSCVTPIPPPLGGGRDAYGTLAVP